MQNSIRDSFFISSIIGLLSLLNEKFKEGLVYNFFLGLSIRFGLWIENSSLWNIFYRKDRLDGYWKNSLWVKLLNGVFNLPIILLRKLYKKFYDVFEASILFKLLHLMAENIEIFIGLSLVFTMIVPDHMWYNIFSVLLVACLVLLFIFKASVEKNYSFKFETLDFSFVIFFICIFLSAVLSLFPRLSLNNLVFYVITFMMVLVLTSSIDSTNKLNKIVSFIVLGAF